MLTKALPAGKLATVTRTFGTLSDAKSGKTNLYGLDLGESVGNKGIYHSHTIREALENKYPGQVTSSTVPLPNQKNVKLAGQAHPKTQIVYDNKGFPIFDDVSKFDTRIGSELSSIKQREVHMRAATANLRKNILAGKVDAKLFTSQQLSNIMDNKSKIDGFTWHHHQDVGRMQLIPEKLHKETGHVGGMDNWYFEK